MFAKWAFSSPMNLFKVVKTFLSYMYLRKLEFIILLILVIVFCKVGMHKNVERTSELLLTACALQDLSYIL